MADLAEGVARRPPLVLVLVHDVQEFALLERQIVGVLKNVI